VVCSFFGIPQNVRIRQKCLKASQLISSPFQKILALVLGNNVLVFEKISIHNEKWYLQLCNLFFPVRCGLSIAIWCETVWSRGQNTTLHCSL